MDEAKNIEKSKDRIEVLQTIERLELEGKFDIDAEKDPPTIPLDDKNFKYIKKDPISKIKTKFATSCGKKFFDKMLKEKQVIIKEVKGIENLQSVKSGAIITCNHFNPFDVFTVETVFRMSKQSKNKTLYKIIREGNYTNFPGFYGFLFKNCNTLPLSSNNNLIKKLLKAVDQILSSGDFILIYPEQSLWWNYQKPKPLKNGAFKMASKNNVPVIPIFITLTDSDLIGNDGFPIKEYHVNIEKPIYPNEDLSRAENTEMMKNKNYNVWKNVYEDFYKIPLEYTTIKKELV